MNQSHTIQLQESYANTGALLFSGQTEEEEPHHFWGGAVHECLRKNNLTFCPKGLDGNVVRQYLTCMITTVSSKGQIVLPAAIRHQDNIKAGTEFDVERVDRGEYLLKRRTQRRNKGLVTLLLACPVKGWFKPMSRKETTDDIQAPEIG